MKIKVLTGNQFFANILMVIVLFVLAGSIAACHAQALPPAPLSQTTLPPPAVHRVTPTHQPPTSAPLTVTPTPKTQLSLHDLAKQVHGTKLIQWIRIPATNTYAPVVPVGWQASSTSPEQMEWDSPDASVGWVVSSKLPDDSGNIIVYAHNNINSSIFVNLYTLKAGDKIELETGEKKWIYEVNSVEIFAVPDSAADKNLFEKFFQPGSNPVLTLVSCYPPTNNTHRVVVLAYPLPE